MSVCSPCTTKIIQLPGSGTNLSYTVSSTQGTVNSDNGSDAVIPLADLINSGLMSPAQVEALLGLITASNNTDYIPVSNGAGGYTSTPNFKYDTATDTLDVTGDLHVTGKVTFDGILDPVAYVGTSQTLVQRDALVAVSPLTKAGYLVYVVDGTIKEYQIWDGTTWNPISGSTGVLGYDVSSAYILGDQRIYRGLLIEANGAIPSNTAFNWGTTGATWKPVIPTGYTWQGIWLVGTTYSTNDVVTSSTTSNELYKATIGSTGLNPSSLLNTAWNDYRYIDFDPFTGATNTTGSRTGLVPQAFAGQTDGFLRSDGEFSVPALGTLLVSDKATGGNLHSTSSTTPDYIDRYVVTQTTNAQTMTLGNASNLYNRGRLVYVENSASSTTSFTIYGKVLDVGKFVPLYWDGTTWIVINVEESVFGTKYSFTDQASFEANTTNVYVKGDYIYIRNPRKLLRVTTGGTGYVGIVTEDFYDAFANRELSSGTQFAADFIPDRVLYGNFYYGGFTPGSGLTNINIADIQNNGGVLIPATGEKLSFVLWNAKATSATFTFDTNYFEPDGVTSTSVITLLAGETKFVDFEGHYGIPSTWRRVVSSASTIEEVTDFATLATLPATTGDLKLVTNEDSRQYLLRYNAADVYGLVPSSGTLQPGVEIIGWNVIPNTVETASAHGLAVNDAFIIRSATTSTLIFEPDIVLGQTYYVKTIPTATTFTLSATPGGATLLFTITMGSPQFSGCFVYTPGWWNVISGGSQMYNEKYLTPRIIDGNDKAVEVHNSEGVIYWEATRSTSDYATTVIPGSISVSSIALDSFSSIGFNQIATQDNVANTRIFTQATNAAQTEAWISGEISTVEKLGIYTYAGSPETFITANKGAVCFDTTTGIIYRKTTDTANTGWTSNQLLATKTTDYTVTEADSIIEVDTTAGAVTITVPNTLTIGKEFTIIFVAGVNALSITSAKNLIDFDGVAKSTITTTVLNSAYKYLNGSINFQLV